MKLALEIINREIAQRKLANKHNHLRKEICTKEIEELESVVNLLSIPIVSGSADADYWSERCKHAENIWEKSPCDPDITDEHIEAYNRYHKFIKENGSRHYR